MPLSPFFNSVARICVLLFINFLTSLSFSYKLFPDRSAYRWVISVVRLASASSTVAAILPPSSERWLPLIGVVGHPMSPLLELSVNDGVPSVQVGVDPSALPAGGVHVKPPPPRLLPPLSTLRDDFVSLPPLPLPLPLLSK